MGRKYRAIALALALVGVFAVPATANATESSGADGRHGGARCERQVTATVTAFDDAFFRRDLDAFMAFYDDDASLMSSNAPLVTPKSEIRIARAPFLARTDWTASFTTLKTVVRDCQSAVVISFGTLTFTSTGRIINFLNTLTMVRHHGKWFVLVDMSTSQP